MLSREVLASSTKFFVPTLALLIFGGLYTYLGERDRDMDRLFTQENFMLSQSQHLIQQNLRSLQENISILSHAPDTVSTVNGYTPESIARLKKLFYQVAKNKKQFKQIRLIDNSGQERIRINQTQNGPVIVPDSSLQNKAERYYFQDAIKLGANQTYYSRIDLNIEKGNIETPYNPMLRVAKTVIDKNGSKHGIVIINYSAQAIINHFLSSFDRKEVQNAMLLDGEGYWIEAPNPNTAWGFMFGRTNTFASKYPNMWSKMQGKPKGQFQTAEGLLTFARVMINPTDSANNRLNTLYLVSLVPPLEINKLSSIAFFKIWGSVFILTILSALAASLISKHELKLEASRRKLALNNQKGHLLNTMIEGVIGLDKNGFCTFANESAMCMTNYSSQQIISSCFEDLVVIENQGKRHQSLSNLLNHGEELETEAFLVKSDNALLPVHLMGKQLYGDDNEVAGAVISFIDLSGEFDAKEKIHQLSNYDKLTDLPNHKLTIELIDEQLKSLNEDQSAILVTIDIDRFSNINSSLGFEAGNVILRELAGRLKNYFMSSAIVGRIGPDEFAIYIPESEPHNRLKYIELLQDLISSPIHLLETEHSIHCSIGVCVLPGDAQNALHAIQNAELAMIRAKKTSGDHIQFYSTGLHTASLQATKLEQDLRHAIDKKELKLYYQPQITVDSKKLKGAEALIRWEHPERGTVSPHEFIPLAEETGFIRIIDNWVLEEGIKQRAKWVEMFPELDFTVSINISSSMFTNSDLIETLYRLMKTYNVDPTLINIELTETSMLGNIDSAIDTIQSLKAIKIGISIDDFGTGYSSLSYLKNLPVDILKIDKSFVDNMLEDKKDAAIVDAIMSIAKGMDLITVAEGIEDEKQLEHMTQLGCHLIQGYYFSKPLGVDDFEDWLT